ncbi:MAG: hypothetical protein HY815_00285 [Candidatus Riflebacteria bacterium]|nr:hypothetical protein [Candidatus Riflebacteria bacterium]
MGISDLFKGPSGKGEPIGQKLQDAYGDILVAVAGQEPDEMRTAVDRYFSLLASCPPCVVGQFENLVRLATVTASRFAAIREREHCVVHYEDVDTVFWAGISSVFSLGDVKLAVERNPQALDRLLPLLMVRLLHFIENRRFRLFEHLLEFLLLVASRFPTAAAARRLERFLALVPSLTPAGDREPWGKKLRAALVKKGKGLDSTSGADSGAADLDPAVARAVQALRVRESLAAALMKRISDGPLLGEMEELGAQFASTAGRVSGMKDGASLTDSFSALAIVTPGGELDLPAVVVFFLEPTGRPSRIPEKLKGRNVHISLSCVDGDFTVDVQNWNVPARWTGLQQKLDEARLAELSAALRRSAGRYLVAAVRLKEPTVRMLWLARGSIDLTGRFKRAIDLLDTPRESEGIALLEELSRSDPYLGEVNYQLALARRGGGGADGFRAARECLLEELSRDPGSYRALSSLGVTAKKEGKLEEAASFFEMSYRRNRYFVENLVSYASTLLSLDPMGNLDRVLELCGLARDLNPTSPVAAGFFAAIKQQLDIDLEKHCLMCELDTQLH